MTVVKRRRQIENSQEQNDTDNSGHTLKTTRSMFSVLTRSEVEHGHGRLAEVELAMIHCRCDRWTRQQADESKQNTRGRAPERDVYKRQPLH